MKDYIATFYSHFGAIRFKKKCDSCGYPAVLMPVPRDLSSSCGTCVRWSGELFSEYPEEVEQVVQPLTEGYEQLYRAPES